MDEETAELLKQMATEDDIDPEDTFMEDKEEADKKREEEELKKKRRIQFERASNTLVNKDRSRIFRNIFKKLKNPKKCFHCKA